MKILLDDSEAMRDSERSVLSNVRGPIRDGNINSKDEVFVDYLTFAVKRSRQRLVVIERFVAANLKPDFIITMLQGWTVQSYARFLRAMNRAIKSARPIYNEHEIFQKFTVPEPLA